MITLNGSQIVTLMVSLLVSAIHICTAMIGFHVTRTNQPVGRLFGLSFFGLAWICFALGLSKAGFGRFFPPIVVAAPLLSGYILVSYYLFCRSVVFPKENINYWTFIFGVFGTIYAFTVLLFPGGLGYVHGLLMGLRLEREIWVLIPFALHSLALIFILTKIIGVLYTGAKLSQDRHQREAQKSLLIGTCVVIAMFLVANVAPLAGFAETVSLAPFITLPIGWMAWRLLSILKTDDRPSTSTVEHMTTRLESLGRMARGMAHDFNNTLGRLVGHAELATLKLEDQAQAQKHLDAIVKLCQQAGDLSHELMALSSEGTKMSTSIDIGLVAEDTLGALDGTLGSNIDLELNIAEHLPCVPMKSNALSSALINLVLNARDALSQAGGVIRVTIRLESSAVVPAYALGHNLDTLPAIYVEVSDNGCGMKPEISAYVFEPFFSTKPNGKGLGLANVFASVRDAGGALMCETKENVGTRFGILLPVSETNRLDPQIEKTTRIAGQSSCDVLLIEDDQELAIALAEMIQNLGYQCKSALSAEDALKMWRKNPKSNQLLVCDVQLPKMDGFELVQIIRRTRRLPVLFISGNATESVCEDLIEQGDVHFLRKPITLEALREKMVMMRDFAQNNEMNLSLNSSIPEL